MRTMRTAVHWRDFQILLIIWFASALVGCKTGTPPPLPTDLELSLAPSDLVYYGGDKCSDSLPQALTITAHITTYVQIRSAWIEYRFVTYDFESDWMGHVPMQHMGGDRYETILDMNSTEVQAFLESGSGYIEISTHFIGKNRYTAGGMGLRTAVMPCR